MTVVKYGLIGCGMMGQEHIKNIALLEGAAVTAVYDPVPELAKASADLAGGAQVCEGLRALVEQVDAIVICSPNHCHVDQLMEIAMVQHLPILCEKPLYVRPEGAPRIADFASRYGAPVWVAMEYRYMPPVAKFIEEVQAATGGIEMLTIREHRFPFLPKIGNWNRFNRNTGGTLVEKCCHFFDLMRLILQSEPVRVMASGAQNVNHKGESYMGETPDIWDNAYVIVDFESGARAMLELCMFAEGSTYQEELTAVGREGKIEAYVPGPGRFWNGDGPAPTPKVVISPRSPKAPRTLEVPVDETLLDAGDHNGSTFYQHQGFLKLIQEGGAPEVGLDDGAQAVAIGLAAQISAQEGRVVHMEEIAKRITPQFADANS
ncbi:MAG: Gfo/Idh/MocA family oxidoreductase [Pseudomonadota bacterium]